MALRMRSPCETLSAVQAPTATSTLDLQPGLDAVVGTAVDAVIAAAIFRTLGPVAPDSFAAGVGLLLGQVVKPVISTTLKAVASSVINAVSGENVTAPENQASTNSPDQNASSINTLEENANANAAGELDASKDTNFQRKFSMMMIASRRNVIAGGARKATDFSVAMYDFDVGSSIHPSNREHRLLQHVQELDADIVALQSVSSAQFRALQDELAITGYQGMRCMRPNSDRSDCFFFRVDRFIMLSSVKILLSDLIRSQARDKGVELTAELVKSESVLLAARFVCRFTDRQLLVTTICLTPSLNQDLQTVQVCAVLSQRQSEDPTVPFILVGNMGFSSSESPYQVLSDGFINDFSKSFFEEEYGDADEGKDLLKVYSQGFAHPVDHLDSSYARIQGKEAEASYDVNENCMHEGCYIFHDNSQTTAVSVLQLPSRDWMGQVLPNNRIPSHHIGIKACLSFKP